MDDVDFMATITSVFGIETAEKSSPTDEKLGEERLGSTDPLESFGPTLLIGSIIFGAIIIFVIIGLLCFRKIFSLSWKSRF